jgi:hypothetical protein
MPDEKKLFAGAWAAPASSCARAPPSPKGPEDAGTDAQYTYFTALPRVTARRPQRRDIVAHRRDYAVHASPSCHVERGSPASLADYQAQITQTVRTESRVVSPV